MQDLSENLILQTDSYKTSMGGFQYPPRMTSMFSYMESRGSEVGFNETVFFGLQYLLKRYLDQRITHAHVDEAAQLLAAHGEPFDETGWRHVVKVHNGQIPLRIRAVPEGSVIPTRNAMMTVESTDAKVPWLTTWFETLLVRGVWYPTTVATLSREAKKVIKSYLNVTSENPDAELPFKLHDFGGRGGSSTETVSIGGMAHLVNFKGSDTLEGIRFANHYYREKMAGFSIPAMEHSTVTSWGRENELDSYSNMLDKFAKPGALLACVSDSWNVWNAIEHMWCGALLERVKSSGATVVVRLDSGIPRECVLKALKLFEAKIGMQVNAKGYKVLPSYFRLLQGDGVDLHSIRGILSDMEENKYSASNIAFGMGGALLQKVNRDSMKFAYKCSSATINGVDVNVFKDPVDDPGKGSKSGRLDYIESPDGRKTVRIDRNNSTDDHHPNSIMRLVYEDGVLCNEDNFATIRARAEKGL